MLRAYVGYVVATVTDAAADVAAAPSSARCTDVAAAAQSACCTMLKYTAAAAGCSPPADVLSC